MLSNKRGFTLIEVMVAFAVLLFVSLAMMQIALVSINSNMANILRDEAVSIADTRMNDMRSTAFNDPLLDATAGTAEAVITKSFRLFSVSFTPTRTVVNLTPDQKQVTIDINWTWKGQPYSHSVTSIVKNPNANVP